MAAKKKETKKLTEAEYYRYLYYNERLNNAENIHTLRQAKLDNLNKDQLVASLKAQVYHRSQVIPASELVGKRDVDFNKVIEELENRLSIKFENVTIDPITYEVKEIPIKK